MSPFLIVLLGIAYVALCVFLILIVLVQPAKKGGGLGSLGGGGGATGALTDSLGATQAEKSMAQWTKYGIAIFFILSLGLTLISNAASQSTLGSPADSVDVENAPAAAQIQPVPEDSNEVTPVAPVVPAESTDSE